MGAKRRISLAGKVTVVQPGIQRDTAPDIQ
jgi:hypothetical protein